MLHLEQEIHEQADVQSRLLTEQKVRVDQIIKAIREFSPVFVYIAARGTSDNAARYAQYLLGIHAHLPVALATPSIHTLYESQPRLERALVLAISQSGQAEDVRQVIVDARKQGALTASITNDAHSPLAEAAQFHLSLEAGPEIAIAATKTYTAQLTAIAMLATALTNDSEHRANLDKLPGWTAETLALSEPILKWVERYRYMSQFAVIGRGYNYCTAFEIGLKIMELCSISGHEYSEADFRHGPIATIQPGFPVISVAPAGKAFAGMLDLLEKLRERQSESIVISNEASAFAHANKQMHLPAGMPEWLTPIVAVIPGQIFAMQLASAKGLPVDQPKGLTKVTVTR